MLRKILPLILLVFCFLPIHGYANEKLKILSLNYPATIDTGQQAIVEATILHNEASLPTVTLYYTYFLNRTILAGGWRISKAELNCTTGTGVSLYIAEIPNPAYNEKIPYNSKIVFYLEVKDPLEEVVLLTCNQSDRWNPYIQFDKYSILVVDESPPEIVEIKQEPEMPTELPRYRDG